MGIAKKKAKHIAKMAAKKAKKKSPAYLKAEQSANRASTKALKKSGPQNSFGSRKKGFNKGLYRGGSLNDVIKFDSEGREYTAKALITNEERALDVQYRINARKARTAYEQYEILNQRLGIDVGAVKERARLLKMTEKD